MCVRMYNKYTLAMLFSNKMNSARLADRFPRTLSTGSRSSLTNQLFNSSEIDSSCYLPPGSGGPGAGAHTHTTVHRARAHSHTHPGRLPRDCCCWGLDNTLLEEGKERTQIGPQKRCGELWRDIPVVVVVVFITNCTHTRTQERVLSGTDSSSSWAGISGIPATPNCLLLREL